MARVIRDQIIASTSVDADGERIPHEAFRRLFDKLPDSWIMNRAHDESLPPVGRGFNKRLETQPDGELVIKLDIEVLDETALRECGGVSIAFSRRVTRWGAGEPAAEISFNPKHFDYESVAREIGRVRGDGITVEVSERVEKALVHEVAIIALAVYCGRRVFDGVLGAIGRELLALLMRLRRKDISDGRTELHLHVHTHVHEHKIVAVLKVDPQMSANELSEVDVSEAATVPETVRDRDQLVRVVGRLTSGMKVQVEYAVYSDGRFVKLESPKIEHP